MFCHLFELCGRTDIPLNKFEECPENNTCEYYDVNDKCSICKVKNKNLSKEKFGWMIRRLVFFKTPVESKSKNTRYISALCLIHPSEYDIWIIQSLRLNKKDNDWYPIFRYHQSEEMREFDSPMALNSYLKKIGYNGRKLNESDFLFKEKEICL